MAVQGWSNQSYSPHLTISSSSGQCHSSHHTQDNIQPDLLFLIPAFNSIWTQEQRCDMRERKQQKREEKETDFHTESSVSSTVNSCVFLVFELKAGQNYQRETRINRRWRDQHAISDTSDDAIGSISKEKESVSRQWVEESTKQPSAREWTLSIICMYELGAFKPTKRYLHSLYSHLQRQFRNDKSACWERFLLFIVKKKCSGCFSRSSHH